VYSSSKWLSARASGERRIVSLSTIKTKSSNSDAFGASIGVSAISQPEWPVDLVHQIVEMVPTAMVIVDQNSVIESANAQAGQIFGYLPSELLQHSIEILLPERFREQHRQFSRTFFASPRLRAIGKRLELFGRRKDGNEFPVEVGLNPVATSDGVKVIAAIVDTSKYMRALQEAEARFRSMIESVSDYAIITLDPGGHITSWNRGAKRLKGYDDHEIVGQHFSILYVKEDVEHGKPEAALKVAAAKGRFEEEAWRVRQDGSRFLADVVVEAVRDDEGQLRGFVKVTRDITQRKEMEMRTLHLIDELKRSNEELNNFAYVASHDLKSPLRGIDQLATWIEEDMGIHLVPEMQDHLRLMRSRVKRMERLLDDLLAYARAGRAGDELVTVNTRELVENIFDLSATNRPIKLQVAESMPVLCTPKSPLDLVFRNLIVNAIKHHDKPEGTIEVSARPIADGFEFTVKDDGPGIPPEHQQRVFGMFQTLKPRDEVEGSGIGLALVKKTVESIGGRVTLESDGKNGCTFRFTWPSTVAMA